MKQNVSCKVVCSVTVPPEDAKFINARINEYYALNWLVDGLPAAMQIRDDKAVYFSIGFDLGQVIDGKPYLNNLYELHVQYYEQNDKHWVVGVYVVPQR